MINYENIERLPIVPKQLRKKWTDKEIQELSKLYPNTKNLILALKFGVTRSSITNRANKYKLHKSSEFILQTWKRFKVPIIILLLFIVWILILAIIVCTSILISIIIVFINIF